MSYSKPSAYAGKKVQCIHLPKKTSSGENTVLEIGKEYNVPVTNITSGSMHIPIEGFAVVFPEYCFQTLEYRKPEECFSHTQALCVRADGVEPFKS